ncbi:MAG: hypothetical protein L3J03_03910 [Desulfobacterales bacterium]|nr:hypothetical protein [Desulfobacterales bacterium]
MDEGVDPTRMCQSLVDKVAQSRQLQAVTDPEILPLFEDWFEELENEVLSFARDNHPVTANGLAEGIGLSRAGAHFMLSKLKREGKIQTGE